MRDIHIRTIRSKSVIVLGVALLSICTQAQISTTKGIQDRISAYWKAKRKWYLIITASKPVNRPEFPAIDWVDKDGSDMKKVFDKLGYLPLRDPLKGSDVTTGNVIAALDAVNGILANQTVIVYFSGHGVHGAGNTDLHLILNDGSEMTLTDWVHEARGGKDYRDPAFKGELIFIIDACDSGNGIFKTGLTAEEWQFPTIMLTSSTVDEKSRKRNDMDASAFSSTLENAASSDWNRADENHDGFLDYLELKHFAQRELDTLYTNHTISARMKPEGVTDQPLFIAYDQTQDSYVDSYDHWLLLSEGVLPEEISSAASIVNIRNGALVPPTIPEGLKSIASLIPDNGYVSALGRGYKALAEGRYDAAGQHFRTARSDQQASTLSIAAANAGLARLYFFQSDFKKASLYYLTAAKYYGGDNKQLLGEIGVSAALGGDLLAANQYLSFASNLGEQSDEPSALVGTLKAPLHVLGFQKHKVNYSAAYEDASYAAVGQSAGVIAALSGDSDKAQSQFKRTTTISDKVARDGYAPDLRKSALVYANGAEIDQFLNTDDSRVLEYYAKAAQLFEQAGDRSSEYVSMLLNYGKALQHANKNQMADTVIARAKALAP